jgi:hypothetical protein
VNANEQDVREVARRAALAIKSCGHVKGQYGDTIVGFCALGALGHASDWLIGKGRIRGPEARREAIIRLAGHSPDPDIEAESLVVSWNDAPERTADEVISALENIAAGGAS